MYIEIGEVLKWQVTYFVMEATKKMDKETIVYGVCYWDRDDDCMSFVAYDIYTKDEAYEALERFQKQMPNIRFYICMCEKGEQQ